MKRLSISSFVLVLAVPATVTAQDAPLQPAVVPRAVINLLADPELDDFTHFLNKERSLTFDREQIWWINEDGHLHVGGQGWGYLRTNRRYRDYHCVLEYKWGERTWSGRADRARDCGLLVHGYGRDGGFRQTWINSIEAQLIEGGSGDLLVLGWTSPDGPEAITELTAEVREDRDGEPVWTAGGQPRVFPPPGRSLGRVNWKHRSPDWVDVKGFRGERDIENPVGEWNRMEVICQGDTIRILLNGVLVNAARGVTPSEGYVCLQSEHAECLIRRYELHPLGTFNEVWKPEKRATDMGYSITGESLLPRRFPLSPEESQRLWRVDSDKYELQLVAAEPVTCDPVDVVWDEQGRMFVAEMLDYPTPAFAGGFLSRIRLLSDTNRDGRMDKAVTWADGLDHVQGLLPINGGLLATTRTAILFLKDTDGDNAADIRQELYHSNAPRHNQLQISCPRWGLDNAIYLNNGLDGKEIHPASDPSATLQFTRLNLRYDPYLRRLEPATGTGQFGASQDDFGRRFFCSNRNPAMFAVMPLAAVKRNPLAGITVGHEDIQPPGAPVYPLALSHTTSDAHAGTHTAACGLAVYRGHLMPQLAGDLLVCDPTAQLVTRNKLVPRGASFVAQRIGNKRDFLVSGDEWCRPVHVRNGPDGALYICDMYRRFIDHARFLPADFQKTHYLRAGFDQGRIWRLVPKGTSPCSPLPLPTSVAGLVAELESPIAWRRTHAQRLLVERNAASAATGLEQLLTASPQAATRAHALWVLQALQKLTVGKLVVALRDEHPGVVENAIVAASRHFESDPTVVRALEALATHQDPRVGFLSVAHAVENQSPPDGADFIQRDPLDVWLRRALASSFGHMAGRVLGDLLADSAFVDAPRPGHAESLQEMATLAAANGDLSELGHALEQLGSEASWVHFSVLIGINDGLRKSDLKQKSLAALIADRPDELGPGADRLSQFLEQATALALDTSRAEVDRIAALPLVAQQGFGRATAVVEKLITASEPASVQAAACRSLSRFDREQVAEFFFDRWQDLPPTPLREALSQLTSSPVTGLTLMRKMKAGEIPAALMPPRARWLYGRSANNEIKNLAIELFGQTAGDRAVVVSEYRAALGSHHGDAERGRAVFKKAACFNCHKIGNVGVDVGPSLADVKIKPAVALLTDILDPNRAVEERWVAGTIVTQSGRVLTGLVQADDASGVTLLMPNGLREFVPRGEVDSFTAAGLSLMPVGLEKVISKAEMADLIAFLKRR